MLTEVIAAHRALCLSGATHPEAYVPASLVICSCDLLTEIA